VSTLSGLVIAPDGRLLSFSILGNNLAQGDQIARARALQESMVRRIVQELAPAPAPHTADAREASRR
jgi:D-alanyl-D-alanine carboxypeptidase